MTNVTLDDEVRDANVHEARDDDDEAEAVTPAPTVVTLITLWPWSIAVNLDRISEVQIVHEDEGKF